MTAARIALFLLALAFASMVGLTIASMPGCANKHSSRLLGSSVEDNPGPAANACIGGWLRPTTRKGGPSATSQSRSATRQATASHTQRADLFSFAAGQP